MGEDGEGHDEGGEDGEHKEKKDGEEGDEGEDKEKKADGEATTDTEDGGESKHKHKVDGGAHDEAKKKHGKLGKGEGKREGGILKLGTGRKHQKQAMVQMIPDRAHAIALAEAVVKNANAAAAAAVAANKLETPGGATIGLHQSHLSAHCDPGGVPKSEFYFEILLHEEVR